METKEKFMQKTIVVWLGALVCCLLWGSAFPILMHGNALPHSAEQSIASNAAIYVFLSVSAFIKTSYITKSSGTVAGRQYRFIF